MLVIDASAALYIVSQTDGFRSLSAHNLVAPPLLWSEVTSVLRENAWRGVISDELAETSLRRLADSPIVRQLPENLYREASDVAVKLGWAKTYDAEYVALAQIISSQLLTVDARLQRGAGHVVSIIGPQDL